MKQYLEAHPATEPPTEDGWYRLCNLQTEAISYNKVHFVDREWKDVQSFYTHWISNEPVTGVLVDVEELRVAIDYLSAFKPDCAPPLQPMLDNLINSLTNKAK